MCSTYYYNPNIVAFIFLLMAQLPLTLQHSLARYNHLIQLAEAAADYEVMGDGLQPTVSAFEAEHIFREYNEPAIPRPLYRSWGPSFTEVFIEGTGVFDDPEDINANVFASLLSPDNDPYDFHDPNDVNEATELLFDNQFPEPLVHGLDARAVYTIAHNPDLSRLLAFIIHSGTQEGLIFDTVHPFMVNAWNFDNLAAILDSSITTDPTREEEAQYALQLLPESLSKFPNVISAMQLLQYPYAVACAVLLYGTIARHQARKINRYANVQMSVQLTVYTQRFLLPDNVEQDEQNAHVGVRRFSPTAVIGANSSVRDAVDVLLDMVRNALFGHTMSNALAALDKVLVVGILCRPLVFNAHVNLLNFPAPIQANVPEQDWNLHNELFRYLHQLHAFRIPVIEDGNMTYLPPAFTSQPVFDDNLCVINSFVYMMLLMADVLTDDRQAMRAKTASDIVLRIRSYFMNRIGEDPNRTNVAWAINRCREIMQERQISELVPVADKSIYIGFLANPSSYKPPSYPMIKMSSDGTLSSCYPMLVYSEAEVSRHVPILVYSYSHVYVMRMGSFRKYSENLNVTAAYHLKMKYIAEFPSPNTIIPIAMERKEMLVQQRREKLRRYDTDEFTPFTDCSLYSEPYHTNYFACDFETRVCEQCGTHEAYCVSLVYGLRPEQQVTFIGLECPLLSTKDYLHEGCMVQLLLYLKAKFGFAAGFMPYQSAAVQRVIQFFNGANFDLYLVLNTLSMMGEQFSVLPLNNAILSVRWGNYVFGDFAKLYPAGSLASLFDTFSTMETPLEIYKPNEGKWECFPYNMIGKVKDCPIEDINTEEAWGHKCCKEFASLGVVAGNIAWWRKYKGNTYNEDILKDYCLSDTRILMYCMAIDFHHIAVGKIGNFNYNLISESTVAARSLSLWRQVFQCTALISPDGTQCLSMRYSSGDPVTLHEAFTAAYQGGIVTRRYAQVVSPDIAEKVREYEEKTGDKYRIDAYDFNSHYPAVMQENDLPVAYLGEEPYASPHHVASLEDLTLTDIYWCSVKYPDKTSGIPCKFNGRSMCPTYIPRRYDDPKAPNKERLTFVYGCELREAYAAGAKIRLYSRLRFRAEPIFSRLMTYLYDLRRATSDEVMKLFYKLMMNSLYGKLGEEQKPETVIIQNLSDIDDPSTICSVRRLVKSRFGIQFFMVQFVPSTKKFNGQFTYIAAAVTAFARAKFNLALRTLESCNSVLGIPARVRYGDTDSFYCCMLDQTDPHVKEVMAQFFHMKELGKLKSETNNEGYVDGAILGRKLLALLPALPEVLQSLREQYLEYAKTQPKAWKMTAKGQNKNMVDPLDFMLMSKGSQAFAEYRFPFRFQKSFERGIVPVLNTSRKVRPGDLSRLPPDPMSSYCAPLPRPMNP